MGIKFDDGSLIDADDWLRINRIIAEKARSANNEPAVPAPRITEIRSRDGVTIKVGNLELKKKPKVPLAQPDYISTQYQSWTIRVWRQNNESVFCCNYFVGEDVRYIEAPYGDYGDENAVIKLVKQCIDQIRGR